MGYFDRLLYKNYKRLMWALTSMPIVDNKVVAISYQGSNGKSEIKDIMFELSQKTEDLDLVWLSAEEGDLLENSRIRVVKHSSLESMKELATARVWIDNCRKEGFIRKRKGQYYIQTWHGDICTKYVERDAGEMLGKGYIRRAKHDSTMVDLMVSSCTWRTNNYKTAFWYDGAILEANLYLNNLVDKLTMGAETKLRLLKKYGLPDCNFVLYAPTFRRFNDKDYLNLNYDRTLDTLTKKYGGNWSVLVRLHPNDRELQNRIPCSDRIINVTEAESFEDLLTLSSVLITDYSGVVFDGFRSNTPTFLYVPDIKEYLKQERAGFYFDLYSLPSTLSKNMDELISNIEEFSHSEYISKCQEFCEQVGYFQNDGVKEVSEKIIAVVKG